VLPPYEVWFDTKIGAKATIQSADGEQGPLGTGGPCPDLQGSSHTLFSYFFLLTHHFRRNRRRMHCIVTRLRHVASIHYTCLVLDFTRSWALSIVILSTITLLTFVQGLSQSLASPLLASERSQITTTTTLVDHALASIATVKAFNTAPFEHSLDEVLDRLNQASKKLNAV
jgi:ATP-binding cassette subfamily B (MDR/TAP) protein 1